MSVLVRPAEMSDAEEISRLTLQLGYDANPSLVSARMARLLSRSDHKLLVAETDGHIAGWLHAMSSDWIDSDACVVVAGLVVDKAFRGRGIGRVLMRHAEEWANELGCSMVRLWTSSTRKAAHDFYKAIGYTHIKTHLSFVKSLDAANPDDLKKLVPKVDES